MENWKVQADCSGRLEVFHPEPGETDPQRKVREQLAAKICADCKVAEPCLQFALQTRAVGFYAGLSEEDRAERYGVAPPNPRKPVSRALKRYRESQEG